MKISIDNKDSICNMALTEKLNIYDANSLYSELQSAIECSQEIKIDWSKAESCDTAIFQIILSAIKTAEKQDKRITVTEPNINIGRAALNIGLDLEKFVKKN